MRKKNIFCKAAAGILAAALVVTSAPTNNMVFVKAAESSSQSDAASEALAETIKKAEALVETDYSTDSWELSSCTYDNRNSDWSSNRNCISYGGETH